MGSHEIIKNLEELLKNETPPTVNFTGTKKIGYESPTILLTTDTDELQKIAREKQNPFFALEAAIKLFSSEQTRSEAFVLMRDALEWLEGKKPEFSPLLNLIYLPSAEIKFDLDHLRNKLSTQDQLDISAYIFRAMCESMVRPENAWYYSTFAKELAKETNNPLLDEARLFHALIATAQNRTDKEDAWLDIMPDLESLHRYKKLANTRNPVLKHDSTLLGETFVIKYSKKGTDLSKEAEILEELSTRFPEYAIPKPIQMMISLKDVPIGMCVLRHISGEKLYDQLKRGEFTAMPRVISALAQIHTRYAPQGTEKLNIKEDISTRLKMLSMGKLGERILDAYQPIAEALQQSKFWAWSKDAHPENWIIGKKLGIIDCEPRYKAPPLMDMANLLEYDDFFTEKEKREYVMQYMSAVGKQGDEKTIIKEYYNAVIHRMICFASAWKTPDSDRRDQTKKAIRRAISAIECIMEENGLREISENKKYSELKRCLSMLRSLPFF